MSSPARGGRLLVLGLGLLGALVVCTGLLVTVLAVAGVSIAGFEMTAPRPELLEEAKVFGQGTTYAGCAEEGHTRADRCGPLEMTCILAASDFTRTCLETAAVAGHCAAVETPKGWAEAHCAARGQAGDLRCLRVEKQVGSRCVVQALVGE